jgi:hypothetical protein
MRRLRRTGNRDGACRVDSDGAMAKLAVGLLVIAVLLLSNS